MNQCIPRFCVDTYNNGLQSQITVGVNHTINTVVESCKNQLSIDIDDDACLSIAQMIVALSVENDLDVPKRAGRITHPKDPGRFMTLWLMPTKLTEHMTTKYIQLFDHELDTSLIPNSVVEMLKLTNN